MSTLRLDLNPGPVLEGQNAGSNSESSKIHHSFHETAHISLPVRFVVVVVVAVDDVFVGFFNTLLFIDLLLLS